MASFQKRGKTWQYTISRYIDGQYKPIRKSGFRTKSEAKVEADEVEYRLNNGHKINHEPIPFDDYFERWFRLYKINISKQTFIHYEYSLKFVKKYFGGKPIQKITRTDYQAFLNDLAPRYAQETVDKIHTHIRSCVLDAIEDEVIRVDFTRKANVIGRKGKRKDEKYLNFNESKAVYDELFNHLDKGLTYYAALLLLSTGMRYSECVGLTRPDFDFDNHTVTINKTHSYSNRTKPGFGKTKNEQSVRTIKVDPKVTKAFKKLLMTMPDNLDRLVFFNPTNKHKVISHTAVTKSLRKIFDITGIERKITIHELRHTHASALMYKKVSINYISERLGHSNPDITFKTYAHILNELREEDESIIMSMY